MRYTSSLLAVVLGLGVTASYGAIQPEAENYYGHSVVLNDGTTTIWSNDFTEDAFLATVYATLGQQTGVVTWLQNHPSGTPLQLTHSGTWASGTVVHHFVAPEGTVFSGGDVVFTGVSDYPGAVFSLMATSDFNGNGGFGGLGDLGTIYAEDTRALTVGWESIAFRVAIPVDVSEFYVVIHSAEIYKNYLIYGLSAVDVTTVPEPMSLLTLAAGGMMLLPMRKCR